ncbi:hypothetical protein J31TS4_24430 [Paenibacillus sp. J31TS4]|uniref:LrgB family protein n=1 Tax=Paenibacillus sp. J31TS4 TaxID=2807195 RepID=UPI001B131BB5|nr:LrgB family protein [Paenibacillus sp. J31TS4]GIP39163.1 hypothetical protein J31TS4_24430 [Paenibacillus sp. J31TS4]
MGSGAAWFGLIGTIVVYEAARRLYKRTGRDWLSPIVLAPLALVALLLLTGTTYEGYEEGARWLTYLLQPATVAFAVPLYKYRATLKKYAVELAAGVCAGTLIAILASEGMALGWKLSPGTLESLLPRSVTTPIAVEISRSIGGVPALTAVFVIVTGIFGMLTGPWLIRLLRIRSGISKGLLMGTASHGAGTAKAYELGELEGTIANLAMIAAALVLLATLPFVPAGLLA